MIDVFAPGRQQDGGNCGAPKGAQDLEAVLLRQHHIENHELVAPARRQLDGARTRRMGIDSNPSPRRSSPTRSHSCRSSSMLRIVLGTTGQIVSENGRRRCEEQKSRRKEFVKALVLSLPSR